MATEKQLRSAKNAFYTLCEMMDDEDWKYDADEDALSIRTGAGTNDLPVHLRMFVEPEKQLVSFLSDLNFIEIQSDRTIDVALATVAINDHLVDGSFDYDPVNERLFFRLTAAFHDSLLSKELFKYMLITICRTVDDYNDSLAKIATGEMEWIDLAMKLEE